MRSAGRADAEPKFERMPNAIGFSHLWRDRTTLVGMGRGDRVVVDNPEGAM
jgi:hypothetical protein